MAVTLIRSGQLDSFYGTLEAVRTIATTNLTLSGLQDIDGDTGADGHRVVVTGQTTDTEDGIYLMRATAWERAPDAEEDIDLGSMLFKIEAGNKAGQLWGFDQLRGAGVVGTDGLTASRQADESGATKVYNEEASFSAGNFTATIANTPDADTQRVYRNGVRQNPGASDDYTIAAATLTFAKKLQASDVILVDYEYTS